jgi:hypothetical protein
MFRPAVVAPIDRLGQDDRVASNDYVYLSEALDALDRLHDGESGARDV